MVVLVLWLARSIIASTVWIIIMTGSISFPNTLYLRGKTLDIEGVEPDRANTISWSSIHYAMASQVSCRGIGISIGRTNIGTILYRSNTVPLYKKDRYKDRYWSGTIPSRYRFIVPSSKNRRSYIAVLVCSELELSVNPKTFFHMYHRWLILVFLQSCRL